MIKIDIALAVIYIIIIFLLGVALGLIISLETDYMGTQYFKLYGRYKNLKNKNKRYRRIIRKLRGKYD